jgi:carboxylesterase
MLGDGSPFDFTSAAHGSGGFGVLLIHGFTGTPFEMRYLGERLAERGFRALGPTLPGHGTTVDELDRTTWSDWYEGVERAVDQLLASSSRVAVVGQSLGGLLALRLAEQRGHDLAAVVPLAAPLWLFGLARLALRATRPGAVLGRLIPRLPKLNGSDIRDRDMGRRNPAYGAIPVRALHQVAELMDVVRADLPAVRVPTLVVHGRRDHTAPYACSEEIAARVAAPIKRHRALERSYHLITMDVERDLVAAEVGDFLAAQQSPPSTAASPDTEQGEQGEQA